MKILKTMAGLAAAFLSAAADKLFHPKTRDPVYAMPTPERKTSGGKNERIRKERGIPTGVAGAKLLRKAAEGRLGVRS